jgi:hypothetical protein
MLLCRAGREGSCFKYKTPEVQIEGCAAAPNCAIADNAACAWVRDERNRQIEASTRSIYRQILQQQKEIDEIIFINALLYSKSPSSAMNWSYALETDTLFDAPCAEADAVTAALVGCALGRGLATGAWCRRNSVDVGTKATTSARIGATGARGFGAGAAAAGVGAAA